MSDIFKALCSLKPNKAMGIDGYIGPMVLKNCADALCVPVHHLFMTSLRCGQLPAEWKIHLITPIFKKATNLIYETIDLYPCFAHFI